MIKYIIATLSLTAFFCPQGHCQDRYYRFSVPSNNYDQVYTPFPEEEKINKKYSENITTYTGTSIPPGVNDGYNSTPGGYFNEMGEEVTKEGNQVFKQ